MPDLYRPRAMPRRYFDGAPDFVRAQILDIAQIIPPAPLNFDIILRPEPAPRRDVEIAGLDFDIYGAQGCHFFLEPHEAAAYRERNRRKRRAWRDLPEATQRAIVRYLES